MASNKGLILGVGILGISAIALMNMDTSTTSYLPQSGGVSGTSPNITNDNYTDDSDDSDDWDAPDCSLAYNSNGDRINNTWVYHGGVSIDKWNRWSCDLNGFRIKVYTDKRTYVAGEDVKVLILKSIYENDGGAEWQPWTTKGKMYGEQLAFFLGIESTDGYEFYNWQHTYGKSLKKGGIPDGVDLNGDLKSNGWPWGHNNHENLGVCMLTLSTSKADVGEFKVRFGGQLGPYQATSSCGETACFTSGDDCNTRESESTKLITILPPDCKQESSAESTKQAESKNILRAEHFIQSYQQNWV
jgi:hypothetical protein